MSRQQLARSLRLWQEREARFRKNWRSKRQGDPRRFFWFQALKNAVAMVNRREEQLRKLGVSSISDRGLELIKEFEGFSSKPYRDPVGVWTIGYGETRGIGPRTRPWSKEKASAALRRRVNRDFLPAVLRLPMNLSQNEVDALASFVYNLGPGIIGPDTTIGMNLRNGTRDEAADALLLYDKAGKPPKPLPGLTRRRRAERTLFLK